MKMYPLKLQCVTKSAIWGGTRLRDEWSKPCDGGCAESWELTCREKEMSKITNGEASGKDLSEYFSECGYGVVSDSFSADGRFPLLVKLIDAADKLSVQVHPDDRYAKAVENDSGKTEMWYIVDADEGAEIIYGFKDGVDTKAFCDAVDGGTLDNVLRRVKVKKGDVFFIPSGLVHAIGEGILIAEIQQNSDLTYRVYDYDRVGKDGKKRELHTDKAKAVARPFSDEEIDKIRYARGKNEDLLANCEYFSAELIRVSHKLRIDADDSFVSLLCIGGAGSISFDGESYEIKKGDSYFLPRGIGGCILNGDMELIASRI